MACYHPLKGFRSRTLGPNGSRRIVFNPADGLVDRPVTVPCGQCVGCRLERSRQWAVRCVHEASLHDDNCFITLTYNDLHLPLGNTLVVSDFQKFMKLLRYHVGKPIRFFHCGEYGENFGRPHYHALLFGYDFPDKYHWRTTQNDHRVYRSELLENIWGKGHCEIGTVTFESAAYCARYIMKKRTGEAAIEHYEFVDPATGEIFMRQPEYTTMSRRPGIGKGFYDKYSSDMFPRDFVVMNGAKFRPPRFYDGQFEIDHPREYQQLKALRRRKAAKHADNNTPDRLKVREEVQLARASRLKREI